MTRRGRVPWWVCPGLGDAPVGAVIAFAGQLEAPAAGPGSRIPATSPIEAWGWMPCDGRSLATKDYPELYAALGHLYDGGTGDTFDLPNYAGYFLRGIDPGKKIDRDPRSPPSPDADGRGVGSTQQSALLTHSHEVPNYSASAASAQGPDAAAPPKQQVPSGAPVSLSGGTLDPPVSATETRPVNIYVNFIIKFTSGLRSTWT